MKRYEIQTTTRFERSYKAIVKVNRKLGIVISVAIKQLSRDPFDLSLKTHKVIARNIGETFSSRVTGDIRIVWRFLSKDRIIIFLDIGGHDKVYN